MKKQPGFHGKQGQGFSFFRSENLSNEKGPWLFRSTSWKMNLEPKVMEVWFR